MLQTIFRRFFLNIIFVEPEGWGVECKTVDLRSALPTPAVHYYTRSGRTGASHTVLRESRGIRAGRTPFNSIQICNCFFFLLLFQQLECVRPEPIVVVVEKMKTCPTSDARRTQRIVIAVCLLWVSVYAQIKLVQMAYTPNAIET